MIVGAGVNVLHIYNKFCTTEDEKDNKLFYGVELECYNKHSHGAAVQIKSVLDLENAVYGHAILKPDCGFEIVTVPSTLRYHKEVLWNKFFSGVSEHYSGGNGCGLHIHISRDAMEPLHLAKVICFINEAINTNFLTGIAGRSVGSGASWCAQVTNIRRNVDGMLNSTYASKSHAMQISGRNNGKTAELRIFQSDPTKQGLFQALEFTDAVIKYCFEHGELEKQMS